MRKRQRLPPLTAADIIRMLQIDGWHEVPGGRHRNYEHPTKRGKVSVSMKWTELTLRDYMLKSVMRQAGWSKDDLERLYANRR